MPAWCDEKWKLQRHLDLAIAAQEFEALAEHLADMCPEWIDDPQTMETM